MTYYVSSAILNTSRPFIYLQPQVSTGFYRDLPEKHLQTRGEAFLSVGCHGLSKRERQKTLYVNKTLSSVFVCSLTQFTVEKLSCYLHIDNENIQK